MRICIVYGEFLNFVQDSRTACWKCHPIKWVTVILKAQFQLSRVQTLFEFSHFSQIRAKIANKWTG